MAASWLGSLGRAVAKDGGSFNLFWFLNNFRESSNFWLSFWSFTTFWSSKIVSILFNRLLRNAFSF